MSAGEAVSVSSTGMVVVLIVLIVLAVLVLLISKAVRAAQGKGQQTGEAQTSSAPAPVSQAAAPAAPAVNGVPLPENQSAGTLELYDCDEKSAAVIMAIVSNESGIPLNRLEFKSIKAIEE